MGRQRNFHTTGIFFLSCQKPQKSSSILRESQANHNNTSKNYHLQSNQQHHEYFRRHAINQSFRINDIVPENWKKCAIFFFFFGKEGKCHNLWFFSNFWNQPFLFENYFWGTDRTITRPVVVLSQWPRKLPEHTVCATSSTDVGRGRSPLCNISHWHMIDDWQRCRML